ncbi:MAG: penicillin acylase family protein, partial [Planctomycetaceae bacterium]
MQRQYFLPIVLTLMWVTGISAEEVEIIRDQWGVAHVYAKGEEALFWGAGYATAEDRLLQMTLIRRKAQGRLSEILGPGENNRNVESDTLSRTLNVAENARRELTVMDPTDRANLHAFAAGINRCMEHRKRRLPPLFEKLGGHPAPWSADHSLAIWMRLAVDFDRAWRAEVKAKRQFENNPDAYRVDETRRNQAPAIDDAAAIVSEQEFRRSWPATYDKLMNHAQKKKRAAFFHPLPPPQSIKASHNWVVSGQRSTTGKPILGGKPQLTVQNPNTTYEIHMTGGRYNVRGMTWPGEPAFLVGFNERCSWAATAMNTDGGDLFEETINPQNPNQYQFRNEWLEFTHRQERIEVKEGPTIELDIRESIHGPVVNHLVEGEQPGEVFTLKSTYAPAKTSSINGMLKMMRAKDWDSFRDGMRDYVAPGAHIVYGDVDGNIGYQSLAQIPTRDFKITLPRNGSSGKDEWEMLPFEFMPSILNP